MNKLKTVPFFSLEQQSKKLKKAVLSAVEEVIDSTDFILGKELVSFEQNFKKISNTKHVVSLSNGTAALYVALKLLDLKAGDEVIMPSATFTATAMATAIQEITPVFADIDASTWNLDPQDVIRKITPKTKAIIVVHLYGNPCNMAAFQKIAKAYNLFLIEDAAQAHGATFNGQRVGSFGDVSCFSFYPSKNLGAMGDAGAIAFDKDEYLEKSMGIRNCGKDINATHKYVGFNYRMTTFQAAVLNIKLPLLKEFNAKRNAIASRYRNEIRNKKLQFQTIESGNTSAYHLFVVRVDSREKFLQNLKENGIGCALHYKTAVHLQEAFQYLNCQKGSLPITEDLFDKCVSIPLFPEMEEEQVQQVIDVLNAY